MQRLHLQTEEFHLSQHGSPRTEGDPEEVPGSRPGTRLVEVPEGAVSRAGMQHPVCKALAALVALKLARLSSWESEDLEPVGVHGWHNSKLLPSKPFGTFCILHLSIQ